MSNSYPEWRNFQFAPNNYYRLFFLHALPSTVLFKFGYALFYQLFAEISTFAIKKCLVRLPSTTSWRHARGRLTHPGWNGWKLRKKTCRVCKKKRTTSEPPTKHDHRKKNYCKVLAYSYLEWLPYFQRISLYKVQDRIQNGRSHITAISKEKVSEVKLSRMRIWCGSSVVHLLAHLVQLLWCRIRWVLVLTNMPQCLHFSNSEAFC